MVPGLASRRNGNDHFPPHDGPFQMGIGIVLIPFLTGLKNAFTA